MEIVLTGRHPLLRDELHVVDEVDGELVLDARELAFASPLDLTAMAALAHTHARDGGSTVLHLPQNDAVVTYVQRMDLLDRLPESTKAGGQTPYEIRNDRHTRLLEVSHLTQATQTEVCDRLCTMAQATLQAPIAARVLEGVGELICNAVSHGASDDGAFIAAQMYTGRTTRTPRLELAICDTGIGVRRHLQGGRDSKNGRIANDAQALARAIQPGVTGTDEPRGNGLPTLIIRAGNVGATRIALRSGTGLVRINRRGFTTTTKASSKESYSVVGTWAWLRVAFPA